MSHNYYAEINLHFVWHTQAERTRLLDVAVGTRGAVHGSIRRRASSVPGLYFTRWAGLRRTSTLAVSIPPTLLVSEFIGRLKGGSSHEVNQVLGQGRLQWQNGYGVVSFGTRDLEWVKVYIRGQKQHHAAGRVFDRLERGSRKRSRRAPENPFPTRPPGLPRPATQARVYTRKPAVRPTPRQFQPGSPGFVRVGPPLTAGARPHLPWRASHGNGARRGPENPSPNTPPDYPAPQARVYPWKPRERGYRHFSPSRLLRVGPPLTAGARAANRHGVLAAGRKTTRKPKSKRYAGSWLLRSADGNRGSLSHEPPRKTRLFALSLPFGSLIYPSWYGP